MPAAHVGVASALLNVSRQLGGALGVAVISTIVTLSTAHATTFGHANTAGAMTASFHAGFTVSAALLAAAAARWYCCARTVAATASTSSNCRPPAPYGPGNRTVEIPMSTWSVDNIPSLQRKIAVVTGASSGIGLATAAQLAAHHAPWCSPA